MQTWHLMKKQLTKGGLELIALQYEQALNSKLLESTATKMNTHMYTYMCVHMHA